MRRSEERILTTHVGSLPRASRLADLLIRQERGEPIDRAELDRLVEVAVAVVVDKQLEAGIDIGCDGEQPRVGYINYVSDRMTGFGGESTQPIYRDFADHPDFTAL